MLGAKARAAEYQAARAASARQQANLEAHEYRALPQSVPVSLSAYARRTATTRNRDTKTYKPLTARDVGEVDRTSNHVLFAPSATELLPTQSPADSREEASETEFVTMSALPSTSSVRCSDDGQIQLPYRPSAFESRPVPAGYSFDSYASDLHMAHSQHREPRLAWPLAHRPSAWCHRPRRPNGSSPLSSHFQHRAYVERPLVGTTAQTEPSTPEDNFLSDSTASALTGCHVFGPEDLEPTKMEIKDRYRRDQSGQWPKTPTRQCSTQVQNGPSSPEQILTVTPETNGRNKYNGFSHEPDEPLPVSDLLFEHETLFDPDSPDSVSGVPATSFNPGKTDPLSSFDFPLDKTFGSEEWCEARLVTSHERKRMRTVMHLAREGPVGKLDISSAHGSLRLSESALTTSRLVAQSGNTDAEQLHRSKVASVAEDWKGRWGRNEKPSTEQDVAKVKAVGNMMVTTRQYALDVQSSLSQKNPVLSPVPDYAIDRSALSNPNAFHSLFEQDDEDWRTPPHRIARDIRFYSPTNNNMMTRHDSDRLLRPYGQRRRV